jgi:hypothetical protein
MLESLQRGIANVPKYELHLGGSDLVLSSEAIDAVDPFENEPTGERINVHTSFFIIPKAGQAYSRLLERSMSWPGSEASVRW